MAHAQGHKQYQMDEVNTSTQGKLILMMYDGAIKYIKMAMECMEKGDMSGQSVYIQKTRDIINELMVALDVEKGGEVCRNLERLYQFTLRQLTLANIKNERKSLSSVLRVLRPLRQAWDQIFNQTEDIVEPEEAAPASTRFAARC